MNIACIVQSRMGSSRLKGKSLVDINGKPMIQRVIERTQAAKTLDAVILATTTLPEDDPLANLALRLGVKCYRGSADDVLDRYYQAAKAYKVKTVVRVTGDCPLVDSLIIDLAVGGYGYVCNWEQRLDYYSTAYPVATFPDGLDVEVIRFEALERAWKEATLVSDREHVTPYIWRNRDSFKTVNLQWYDDLSHWRLTVDEQADLKVVRQIYAGIGRDLFGYQEAIAWLEAHPEVAALNQHIRRNEGYQKSLKEDRST